MAGIPEAWAMATAIPPPTMWKAAQMAIVWRGLLEIALNASGTIAYASVAKPPTSMALGTTGRSARTSLNSSTTARRWSESRSGPANSTVPMIKTTPPTLPRT